MRLCDPLPIINALLYILFFSMMLFLYIMFEREELIVFRFKINNFA